MLSLSRHPVARAARLRYAAGGKSAKTKSQAGINPMKSTNLISTIIALVVTATLGLTAASAKDKQDSKLLAKAKITKAAAEKTALTKAPDGTVKDTELEAENGKLVWSFDIARPGTKNITEVQVDAITGKIVLMEVEAPKDQAKEAKEDKEGKEDEGKEKAGKK
jgi:uncharacterized membrane protein YkoI